MLTWGRTYWPIFLEVASLFVILGFGIPETIALLSGRSAHTDNTLSNYAHYELHVSTQMNQHTVAWWLSIAAWSLFVWVITAHIWFDLLSSTN